MNTSSRGVEKSAPLFAFVVTIFLVCSLLSYLCHFLGVQALLFRLLDSCHYLNVTLVPYPPTFLPVFASHSLSFVLVQNLSFLSPTSLHCLGRHAVPGCLNACINRCNNSHTNYISLFAPFGLSASDIYGLTSPFSFALISITSTFFKTKTRP